ncbi:MAG: lipase family alpha/beta hydrolase [Pseudomonadota bacterium]
MIRPIAAVVVAMATLCVSALSSPARADCLLLCGSYTKTKYPIVLVHGAAGFDQLGPIDYFYGIPQALMSGGASVYVPQVSAINSTEVRGEQLLAQVQDIVAITGKPKVNLIGHSHGSPTARYVAGVAPQLVASVTGVGGVNKGAAAADLALGITDNALIQAIGGDDIAFAVVDAILPILGILTTGPLNMDARASLQSLSTAGSVAFNQRFPGGVPVTACGQGAASHNGIRYWSWSGDARGTGQITHPLDILDAPLGIASVVFLGAANDGLVGSCSSHLGTVIRDNYYQNHLDEMNHLLGLISPLTANPKSLFREHANRLKNAGL